MFYRLAVVLHLLMACSTSEGVICRYYEGETVTLEKSGVPWSKTVDWTIRNHEDEILYRCACNRNTCPCSDSDNKLNTTQVTACSVYESSYYFTTRLEMRDIGRDLDKTTIMTSDTDIVCDTVEVYALPNEPECNTSLVVGGLPGLEVTCSTNRTYPPAGLEIGFDTNNTYGSFYGNFSDNTTRCEHKQVSSDPVYYTSQCVVTVQVNQLFLGSVNLHVRMYPRLTNTSWRNYTSLNLTLTIDEAILDKTEDAISEQTSTTRSMVPRDTGDREKLMKGAGIGVGGTLAAVVVVVVIIAVVWRWRQWKKKEPKDQRYSDLDKNKYKDAPESYVIPEDETVPKSRTVCDNPNGPTTLSSCQNDNRDSVTSEDVYEYVGGVEVEDDVYMN